MRTAHGFSSGTAEGVELRVRTNPYDEIPDGFFHDPRALTERQAELLESLSKEPFLSEKTRGDLEDSLEDHRNGVHRFGLDGQLGRPDAPRVVELHRII